MESIHNILLTEELLDTVNTLTVSYKTARKNLLKTASWSFSGREAIVLTSDYGREEYFLFEDGKVVSRDIRDVMSRVLGYQDSLSEGGGEVFELQLIKGLEDGVIALDTFIQMWEERGESSCRDICKKIVRMHYDYEIYWVDEMGWDELTYPVERIKNVRPL